MTKLFPTYCFAENRDYLATCYLRGWAAWDKATGIYLARSSGRRRTVQGTRRYILHVPDYDGNTPRIYATTDVDALDRANKWLEKQGL